MTVAEVHSALGLDALKTRTFQIFKTSAIKGEGLDQSMDWLANALASRKWGDLWYSESTGNSVVCAWGCQPWLNWWIFDLRHHDEVLQPKSNEGEHQIFLLNVAVNNSSWCHGFLGIDSVWLVGDTCGFHFLCVWKWISANMIRCVHDFISKGISFLSKACKTTETRNNDDLVSWKMTTTLTYDIL